MAGWSDRRTDVELPTCLPNPCPFCKFGLRDTQVAFLQLFTCRICPVFADRDLAKLTASVRNNTPSVCKVHTPDCICVLGKQMSEDISPFSAQPTFFRMAHSGRLS
jgi:hypothetical protein